MAGVSTYTANKVLDHILSDGAFTEPANIYLGLWTSALTDSSTGATSGEASYTGYARKEILATDLSAASAKSKTNSADIVFADCTAGTDTITYWAILDSSSGAGNIIVWGTCTSTVISTTQTPAKVAAGGLVVSLP